jgi:hypothetical protein
MPSAPRRFALLQAALPFLTLLALSVATWSALWWLDHGAAPPAPWVLWGDRAASDALLGFAEVTVAVLAIAITVVAIVVELAATRYTPRITELFVRDPVNVSVMGLFVVTSVVVTWSELSLHVEPYPRALAVGAIALMTASQLALLPYFAYVFDFLSPTRVIERIRAQGSRKLRALAAGRSAVGPARADTVRAIEQLGDIALNSVEKKDKMLTLAALQALEGIALDALSHKGALPPGWFDTDPLVRTDQDFVALHPDLVRALTERRTWLEMKVLRQVQDVFGEALNRMRDVNHVIAIHTRRIAVAALHQGDEAASALAVRFVNTFVRSALNARDVRTVYNLFNEYRVLGERALELGQGEVVLQAARFLKVYGQISFSADLPFLLETAAYDVGRLLEVAHARGDACHDALLGLFLELDREADGSSQEASLRGVRKAQIKLGTWYLVRGDEAAAERVAQDLRSERPDRLRSIRAELEQVVDAEYWEVSDRGVNFEFLPEAQRAVLPALFERVGAGGA